jgi:hypothetical protein
MKNDQNLINHPGRASAFSASPFFILLCGCQRAPTISIAGSFFPIWILCVAAGIVFAAIARLVFIRLGLDQGIKPSILIYPCVAVSFALTVWLIFFR